MCVCLCVAAELGDYDDEMDSQHLEMKQYVPNQEYLDHKITKFHRKHRYKLSCLLSNVHRGATPPVL